MQNSVKIENETNKNLKNKKVFIFDLDKTLTRSKTDISKETAGLLGDILKTDKIAIISGGAWPQFKKQLIGGLPRNSNLSNLLLATTSGGELYKFGKNKKWQKVYSKKLSKETKKGIINALKKAIKISGVEMPKKIYGKLIEDRISQITMSAVGQKAPVNIKEAWDPRAEKKLKIVKILKPMLPKLHIASGGSTSIDITEKGIDKAFGVKKILEHWGLKIKDAVYIGDALYPGGNDEIVKKTKIDTVAVKDFIQTRKILKMIKNNKYE